MNAEVSRFTAAAAKNKIKVALVESVTCGMISSLLGTAKGASEIFAGSIVCYSPKVKKKLLGISPKLIKKYSCESPEVTKELAMNLPGLIKADIYGAVTGLAADDPEAKHPKGTVFFCVWDGKKAVHETKHFRGSPLEIREKASVEMLRLLTARLKK